MDRNEHGRNTGGNINIALSVFIIFILIFEDWISVPIWLQPVGRMHPLVLHLPIVVVLLAMGLEFFRIRPASGGSENVYDKLTRHLMFAGIILSGITVVMGMFLAHEGGYDSAKLFWHKWTGVAVYFLAVFVYNIRDHQWYHGQFSKIASLVTCIALILAGHLGGSITHGDNFLFAPVTSFTATVVPPVEEARVFEHVIKPLFQSKCASCHNEQKKKGELLLIDSSAIAAGGKSGELFIAGDADSSLLLQRLHLPLDDKKHMPPRDKPQLTKQEMLLLHHWVKSGANFTGRVAELPEADTFRILAVHNLETRRAADDMYDFPAVAGHTLEKLNSNYRVIRPVSENSPALAVNVYDRNIYSPRTLDELKDVSEQVISLDAARMPVTDADLKYISRLKNLETLNVNFTHVTARGLASLHSLEKLSELSVSGTRLKYEDLRQVLAGFGNLRTVAIWNTGLSESEMAGIRQEFRGIEFLGESSEEVALIKLNPPRLKNKIKVFTDTISLDLFHPVNGVDIRFTVDGADPDSIMSQRFTKKTIVSETKSIRARAYKNGWLSSDVTTLRLYKCALKPDTAILLSKLNRVHPANGAWTFFDHELGSFNANSPAWANNWAGFLRNDMELLLRYKSPVNVTSVDLNMLIEIETSIFPPSEVQIWGGESPEDLRLIKREKIKLPTDYRKPFIDLLSFSFEQQQVSYLKIIVRPVEKLPEWHKNKGKRALILIDEILVN